MWQFHEGLWGSMWQQFGVKCILRNQAYFCAVSGGPALRPCRCPFPPPRSRSQQCVFVLSSAPANALLPKLVDLPTLALHSAFETSRCRRHMLYRHMLQVKF